MNPIAIFHSYLRRAIESVHPTPRGKVLSIKLIAGEIPGIFTIEANYVDAPEQRFRTADAV